MSEGFRPPSNAPAKAFPVDGQDARRQLKAFRYVVESVNRDAQAVWSDLWKELEAGVMPDDMTLPETGEGFQPKCGWTEFLEKFWLLKHYLDYVHRFAAETLGTEK